MPLRIQDLPIEEIKALCKRHKVRELALFGSALRQNASARDIDVLVEFEPDAEVGFLTLARMQRELAEILHHKVDLVPKEGLKPLISDVVLSSAEVLYEA